MNFKPELCAKVLSGQKTVTRRPVQDGKPCAYKPGKDYAVCPGRGKRQLGPMRVLDVQRVVLGEITDTGAEREGFANRAEFVTYWAKLYGVFDPSIKVWRIEFELVSRVEDAR